TSIQAKSRHRLSSHCAGGRRSWSRHWRGAIPQKRCERLRWRDGRERRTVHQMPRRLPSLRLQSKWSGFEISRLRKTHGDSSLDGFALTGPHYLRRRPVGLALRALRPWLHPQVAIQCPVLDRFGKVLRFEILGAFQIRDGARDFQNAIVAAGGEAELGDGVFHDAFAVRRQDAGLAKLAWRRLSVGVDVIVEEAAELRVARRDDRMTDSLRRYGGTATGKTLGSDRGG